MKDASGFGYEKLLVWQRSVEWACKIINAAGSIDTARKHYRLVEQLEAASASVSMNIAEGKGRYSKKEFVRFLFIARGSIYEALALLEIFYRHKWIDASTLNELRLEATEIVKMLNSLINSIKSVQNEL